MKWAENQLSHIVWIAFCKELYKFNPTRLLQIYN